MIEASVGTRYRTVESISKNIVFMENSGVNPTVFHVPLGTSLRLEKIPRMMQELLGVGDIADVTLIQFDAQNRGVRFEAMQKAISLRRLGAGVEVTILSPALAKVKVHLWRPAPRNGVPDGYLGQLPNGRTVFSPRPNRGRGFMRA